ncbi:MAG: hypothetical protein FJ100_01595 [Deltaproteobacteria bacterium]|nr:hypothetical protein [Deltaproteobacteria bacterium]
MTGVEAAQALDPPAQDIAVPRWLAAAISLGAALGCFVAVAALLRSGAAVSASAAGWLDALRDPAAEAAPLPWLVAKFVQRLPAQVRAEPQWAVQWVQIAVGGLGLFGVFALARATAGLWTAVASVAVVLGWPDARAALCTASAESVVAVAAVWLAWGALHLPAMPVRGGVVLGVSAAAGLLATPLGLLLVPLWLVGALVLPTATAPDSLAHESGRPDLPAGSRWLAWTGAALLAAGCLAVALHGQPAKAWGAGQLAQLREPTDALALGWAVQIPVLGTLTALCCQVPVVALLLGGHAVRRGLGHESAVALAAPVGVFLALLAALATAGLPLVGDHDPVRMVAPLFAVLAGIGLGRRALALHDERRWGALLMWLAAWTGCLAVEATLLDTDRRNVLGHLPGLLTETDTLRPAELRPADLALLQHFDRHTAVLPARPGGARLATAVAAAVPGVKVPGFCAPHRAQLALLPEPPRHLVDRAFADHGQKVACTADLKVCMHRLVGR